MPWARSFCPFRAYGAYFFTLLPFNNQSTLRLHDYLQVSLLIHLYGLHLRNRPECLPILACRLIIIGNGLTSEHRQLQGELHQLVGAIQSSHIPFVAMATSHYGILARINMRNNAVGITQAAPAKAELSSG